MSLSKMLTSATAPVVSEAELTARMDAIQQQDMALELAPEQTVTEKADGVVFHGLLIGTQWNEHDDPSKSSTTLRIIVLDPTAAYPRKPDRPAIEVRGGGSKKKGAQKPDRLMATGDARTNTMTLHHEITEEFTANVKTYEGSGVELSTKPPSFEVTPRSIISAKFFKDLRSLKLFSLVSVIVRSALFVSAESKRKERDSRTHSVSMSITGQSHRVLERSNLSRLFWLFKSMPGQFAKLQMPVYQDLIVAERYDSGGTQVYSKMIMFVPVMQTPAAMHDMLFRGDEPCCRVLLELATKGDDDLNYKKDFNDKEEDAKIPAAKVVLKHIAYDNEDDVKHRSVESAVVTFLDGNIYNTPDLGITCWGAWKLLGRHILRHMNMFLPMRINFKHSSKNIENNALERVRGLRKVAGKFNVEMSNPIADLPSYLIEYGIPVSEHFVAAVIANPAHFTKFSYGKGNERRPNIGPVVYPINEMPDTTRFGVVDTSKPKRYVYRALVTMDWHDIDQARETVAQVRAELEQDDTYRGPLAECMLYRNFNARKMDAFHTQFYGSKPPEEALYADNQHPALTNGAAVAHDGFFYLYAIDIANWSEFRQLDDSLLAKSIREPVAPTQPRITAVSSTSPARITGEKRELIAPADAEKGAKAAKLSEVLERNEEFDVEEAISSNGDDNDLTTGVTQDMVEDADPMAALGLASDDDE